AARLQDMKRMGRRWSFLVVLVAGCGVAGCGVAGCGGAGGDAGLVWGRRGVQPGELIKPRAAAIDDHDRIYIVDWTARIQVFDADGNYLKHTWTTPDYRNGRPSGLAIDQDGNLLVSDSHYHCFRIYTPEGEELRVIDGSTGGGAGPVGYVRGGGGGGGADR